VDTPALAVDRADLLGEDALGTLRGLAAWWTMLVGTSVDRAGQHGLDRQVAILRALTGSERGAGRATAVAHVELLAQEAVDLIGGHDVERAKPDGLRVADTIADSLRAITETASALRTGEVLAEGVVEGLYVSDGGVPKHPIPATSVLHRGLIGDRQATRRHHGRVWQAVCLWSVEVVERLQAEGHPIGPGAAGENVSIRGIDWTVVRPGTRLHLGDAVVLEVSLPALPCYKNAAWFVDGDFNRMNHEREWGISRMYASVVTEGPLAGGMAAVLVG
jgi:MOSC domain-containing protein YiiM